LRTGFTGAARCDAVQRDTMQHDAVRREYGSASLAGPPGAPSGRKGGAIAAHAISVACFAQVPCDNV